VDSVTALIIAWTIALVVSFMLLAMIVGGASM
jgi:hypothetical protein